MKKHCRIDYGELWELSLSSLYEHQLCWDAGIMRKTMQLAADFAANRVSCGFRLSAVLFFTVKTIGQSPL
jgi:hypothetical protein